MNVRLNRLRQRVATSVKSSKSNACPGRIKFDQTFVNRLLSADYLTP
jgi:hypothetical protein